jgi:hypothetical protein
MVDITDHRSNFRDEALRITEEGGPTLVERRDLVGLGRAQSPGPVRRKSVETQRLAR